MVVVRSGHVPHGAGGPTKEVDGLVDLDATVAVFGDRLELLVQHFENGIVHEEVCVCLEGRAAHLFRERVLADLAFFVVEEGGGGVAPLYIK